VLVLYRPIPALAEPRKLQALGRMLAQPRHAELDGLQVSYVPFVSPPRPRAYGSWGSWAAPTLRVALARLRRRFPFDLVHAHNAVPTADAVLRAGAGEPLVVSLHGPDVLWTPQRYGEARIRRALGAARLVLANSSRIADGARALGARDARVVHLGADVPVLEPDHEPDTLVTVGHLIARKRHADVLRVLEEHTRLRYLIVGDGPERGALEALAARLGVAGRVIFTGALGHEEALARARRCAVFVMPSTDEAFGVAYVEAMAGGLPAIGLAGEPGPEEIAAAGPGLLLARRDALAESVLEALDRRDELGRAARRTVEEHFTWEACGRATVAAYEDALR
jgi:teichuronic acid biosynthesis glycosyltransferase TuaC